MGKIFEVNSLEEMCNLMCDNAEPKREFKKRKLIKNIHGFKEVSVCEDEDEAYIFWTEHFNPNPDDCCNLRHGQYDVATKRKIEKTSEKHLRRLV